MTTIEATDFLSAQEVVNFVLETNPKFPVRLSLPKDQFTVLTQEAFTSFQLGVLFSSLMQEEMEEQENS